MALRTTRFLGPLNAQMVAITAAQAGQTASLGPIAWGVDPGAGGGGMEPNATLSIVVEPMDAQAIAPHVQWFDVADLVGFTPAAPGPGQTFNPQAHDITYIWDFGDPGSVPHPACNLPDAWRNTNVAYGKRVCHVYDGPGTYTATVWAFDQNGHYGTATATRTVADPATVFAGNRTICVNPTGDASFPGAPAGAQLVQGYGAMQAAIAGLGSTTHRILLKRGATYVGEFQQTGSQPNLYVHAYGPGADPILDIGSSSIIFGLRYGAGLYNKVIGVDYRGGWDPELEVGTYGNFFAGIQGNLLFHKCRLRNIDALVVGYNDDGHGTVTLSASYIDGWREYGLLVGGQIRSDERLAVIGTAIHQKTNALVGHPNAYNEAKVGASNGPVRAGTVTCTFWSCSSIFSNNGWSPNENIGAIPRTQTHTCAVQGSLRLGEGVQPSFPIINNADRFVLEGGAGIFAMAGFNETTNWVADKVIIIGNSYAAFGRPIHITGGCTLRNVFIYWPNTPAGQQLPAGVINNSASTTNGANARRVAIYGLTFYSPITGANKANAGGGNSFDLWEPNGQTPFTNLIAENNVIHLPAQGVPQAASAPLQLVAIPGLTTLFRGPRWNFPTVNVTLAANVPPGGTLTFPYPNDTALHPNGRATNQAYFLAGPGLGAHMLGISGDVTDRGLPLRAALGEFSVTFGASNITVTNNSGVTWPAGRLVQLLLDRRNDLVAPLAQYASPTTVEIPVPIAGSPALGGAINGLIPIDDLLTGRRPSSGASRGARDPVAA
jgi:hypothetical protein